MREWEMRQRIERIFKRRVPGILAPTLGLGLAIVGFGCGGTEYGAQYPHGSSPRLDAGDVILDAAGPRQDVPIYSAPIPLDAAPVDAPAGNELDASPDGAPTLDQR
jgi:hypothetical protein